MNMSRTLAAATALLLTASLSACDKYTNSGETVGQKVDKAIDKTNQKVSEVGDKVGAGVDKAGGAVASAASSVGASAAQTGEALNDGAITASIKTDFLKDPDLSVLKIDVDTKNGVVALNGLAKDEAARQRAEKIASAIKGVVQVNNHLVVKKL